MKNMIRILSLMFLVTAIVGCNKQAPIENMAASPEYKMVAMDEPIYSQEEADLIIMIQAPALLTQKAAFTHTPVTLLLNGREVKELSVRTDRSSIKKRLRLKPGTYEILIKAEKGVSTNVKTELAGGRLSTLRFKPIIKSRMHNLKRAMRTNAPKSGYVQSFEAYLDGQKY